MTTMEASRRKLFEPYSLGTSVARNRVIFSPISQSAATAGGEVTPWHLVHYGSRAVGGVGTVMVEDTAVLPGPGRTGPNSLGAYDDRQVAGLAHIAQFCRHNGALAGLQLSHAGPKGWAGNSGKSGNLISASHLPYKVGGPTPRAASTVEIARIVKAFRAAAKRARKAGFEIVEVHATYGSLLHQFLSPLTNLREDSYGGDLESRSKLLLSVVEAVAEECGATTTVGVRLPAIDGASTGLTSQDVAEIAQRSANNGVRLVTIAGSLPLTGSQVPSQNHIETASAVLAGTSVSVNVSVGVKDIGDAGDVLDSSGADLISVGRALLSDPYWVLRSEAAGSEMAYPTAPRSAEDAL